MNLQNRVLVMILVMIWCAFGWWQFSVQELLLEMQADMIRLDLLLVLPALLVITVGLLLFIRSDNKK